MEIVIWLYQRHHDFEILSYLIIHIFFLFAARMDGKVLSGRWTNGIFWVGGNFGRLRSDWGDWDRDEEELDEVSDWEI
jgi:hypothetical protein